MSLFKAHQEDEKCPQCTNGVLQIKSSKKSKFLGCNKYPDCDFIVNLTPSFKILKTLDEICPECSHSLVLNQGSFGIFIGCSNYPNCHFTVSKQTNNESSLNCPLCDGKLLKRSGMKGSNFYGCQNYPKCKFSSPTKPLEKQCPQCLFAYSIQYRNGFKCLNQNCQHIYKLSYDYKKVYDAFHNEEVFAYPTESVFGLGCDPKSETALTSLIQLKQRSNEKGFILIASDIKYLDDYLDMSLLTKEQKSLVNQTFDKPRTWIVPVKSDVQPLLTGAFKSIAVRISQNNTVKILCKELQSALVSTSANLSGQNPCKNYNEVIDQFGENFPVIKEETNGVENPSQIFDLISLKQLR